MPVQEVTPGAALRSLRQTSGMTLKEVATAADTSIAYLSKVEVGKFTPTPEYIARVSFFISKSMLIKASAA